MKRIDIESQNIEFKNLLSGPAPIGRILNYLYFAGTSGLYHKNGYRSLDFSNNVGSAWATEFMIGLELVYCAPLLNNKNKLLLTKRGQQVFDIIKGNYSKFIEGTSSNEINLIRSQINNCSPKLLDVLHSLFVSSLPFIILKGYLNKQGFYYNQKDVFMDDFFETVKNTYDSEPTLYNRYSRTPTSRNRVPSLLQLCELFGMMKIRGSSLYFDMNKINVVIDEDVAYSATDLSEALEKDELIIKNVQELIAKYGMDGNQVVETITRNGSLQKLFKHNLMISQNRKCIMCGMENEELLIGSHIRPSSQSDAAAKADHNNGLLLCCNHDKLFDHYLITFNFLDGQIEISKAIIDEDRKRLQLDSDFCLPEEFMTPERKIYFMEHNIEFNKKEENR